MKEKLRWFVKIDWNNQVLEKPNWLTKQEIQWSFIQAMDAEEYNELRMNNLLLGKSMQLILVTFNPKDDQWFNVGELRTNDGNSETFKIEINEVYILKKYIPLRTVRMQFMKDLFVINKNAGIHTFFEDGQATIPHFLID